MLARCSLLNRCLSVDVSNHWIEGTWVLALLSRCHLWRGRQSSNSRLCPHRVPIIADEGRRHLLGRITGWRSCEKDMAPEKGAAERIMKFYCSTSFSSAHLRAELLFQDDRLTELWEECGGEKGAAERIAARLDVAGIGRTAVAARLKALGMKRGTLMPRQVRSQTTQVWEPQSSVDWDSLQRSVTTEAGRLCSRQIPQTPEAATAKGCPAQIATLLWSFGFELVEIEIGAVSSCMGVVLHPTQAESDEGSI